MYLSVGISNCVFTRRTEKETMWFYALRVVLSNALNGKHHKEDKVITKWCFLSNVSASVY